MHCRHVLRNSLHQIEMNGKKMLYIISSQRNMLFPSKDDFRHKREDHLECISWRLLTRLTFNFENAQLLSCHLIKSLNLMSELISGGHTEHLLREQEKLHSSLFHNKCFNKSVIEYFGEFRVQSFELRSIIMNSIIALSRVQHV